jgi:N-acyl homoserine lactone hydrolase
MWRTGSNTVPNPMPRLPKPVPMTEALPGRRDGATVTVEPLLSGEVLGPSGAFERTGGALWPVKALGIGVPRSQWWRVPIPAYLVRHPGAGVIIVDAGLHSSMATDPKRSFGRIAAKVMQVDMRAELTVARHLAARGVSHNDLAALVMTHLHLDHTSGLPELPPIPAIVSEAEWKAATTGRQTISSGYRRQHLVGSREWRTVDMNGPLAREHEGFPQAVDLLDDGSIWMVSTPGHTAGHCSLICRLKDGYSAVIGGDAVYTIRQLDDAPEPPRAVSWDDWRASRDRLRAYRDAHGDRTTIFAGHDPRQWPTLSERYE